MQIFKKRFELEERIIEENHPKKQKALYMFLAIVFSLFFVSAPLLVLINLLIYVNYLKLIIYGMVVVVVIFLTLALKFYYDQLIRDEKTYPLWLIDGLTYLVIMTVIYFISWIWW